MSIDWTDKTLTPAQVIQAPALVLIHSLSLLNYFGKSDKGNMKNYFIQINFIFYLFFSLVILTSCVSVQVPFGPVPKAEKASVTKPPAPFYPLVTSTADEAWISEKTGNTISYLSECKKTDETVEAVALDAAKAINQSKILKSTNGTIDSKRSSELIVTGKEESQKVKMAITVFRSENCLFSITYGGLEEKFDEESKYFEQFKKGFHIP